MRGAILKTGFILLAIFSIAPFALASAISTYNPNSFVVDGGGSIDFFGQLPPDTEQQQFDSFEPEGTTPLHFYKRGATTEYFGDLTIIGVIGTRGDNSGDLNVQQQAQNPQTCYLADSAIGFSSISITTQTHCRPTEEDPIITYSGMDTLYIYWLPYDNRASTTDKQVIQTQYVVAILIGLLIIAVLDFVRRVYAKYND